MARPPKINTAKKKIATRATSAKKKTAVPVKKKAPAKKPPAEQVTIEHWLALVRAFVRAGSVEKARAIYDAHKNNGLDWELPALLDDEPDVATIREMTALLNARLDAVSAGGDLWLELLSLRDEIHDS